MNRFLLLPFLLLASLTCAQEPIDTVNILSEVTVVADKMRKLPGSAQYIGRRKLDVLNQPNFNHVLRTVPGVMIRDEEGFGLRPNIGLRGTPVNRSAKITLMEDGILIAPATYADPAAYYFPTFLRMSGVEVLKGSSQIKYGPYTIGGAINLLSTPIPRSFQGFAQLAYGSFNTSQQRIWVGDSRENFDYVFEVNRYASDGFKQLDNGGNTGFERRDIVGKLRWHTAESAKVRQYVTLKFISFSEDGNESYLGLTYDDYQVNALRRYAATQKDKLDMTHSHASLNYTILPAKGLSISATGYYSHVFRDWARVNTIGGQGLNSILADPLAQQTAYRIMTGQADGHITYQSAARTFVSQGVQANAQYLCFTQAFSHKIQAGVRMHEDKADRYGTRSTYAMTNGLMVLTAAGVQGNQENQIRKAEATAAYLTYDISYKGLKFSPGVRYEKIKFALLNYGNADAGRLGMALQQADNEIAIVLPGAGVHYESNSGISAFAGVHKGFSPPGMPALTSTSGQAQPEISSNFEAGIRYNKEGIDFQLTGFLNNYDNILGSDMASAGGAGTGDMFNAGNARIQGLEAVLDYDLLHRKDKTSVLRLPISLAYTYTNARFKETFLGQGGDFGSGQINEGDFIPFTTPHLLTASIGIEHSKFNATLLGRYVGITRTKPGQDEVIVPAPAVKYSDVNAIGAFFMVDLSGNYRINRAFTVFATANNLTNNKAIAANLPNGFRPNMPFNLNAGVKVNF